MVRVRDDLMMPEVLDSDSSSCLASKWELAPLPCCTAVMVRQLGPRQQGLSAELLVVASSYLDFDYFQHDRTRFRFPLIICVKKLDRLVRRPSVPDTVVSALNDDDLGSIPLSKKKKVSLIVFR